LAIASGNASAGASGTAAFGSGTGTTSTGAVTIASGNASAGNSGAINIAAGTATTTRGTVNITSLRTASVTAAAITAVTVLTQADSGGVFSVSQGSAYDIDLPSPTLGPGLCFQFYLTGPAANAVTITVAGAAATFVGTIINDVTSVIPATGATLTFASGASVLGDNIEIISISTTLYLVRAVTSAAGGITIA
jgi:hypothetical protein